MLVTINLLLSSVRVVLESTLSITKSVHVVPVAALPGTSVTKSFPFLGSIFLGLPYLLSVLPALTWPTCPSTEPNVITHELTEPELPGCDLQLGYICSTSFCCIKCNSPLKRPRIFFWFNNFLWLSFYMQQHSKLKLNDRLQLHNIKLYILHRWIKVPIAEVCA